MHLLLYAVRFCKNGSVVAKNFSKLLIISSTIHGKKDFTETSTNLDRYASENNFVGPSK